MWNKIVWGLGIIAVLLLIGFSLLIIPAQVELNQMREEAKATEKRLQEKREHAHEHYHGGNETHTGILDLEPETETTVEPNTPVSINERDDITKTTEPLTVGIGAKSEVFRYKEGTYKGMTQPEAAAFWGKRAREATEKYRNIQDTYDALQDALVNANHSGVAILFNSLKQAPPDVYERVMDQFFKNDPQGRERFEATAKLVEKHSYSGSLADQVSSFQNEKGYRQMLRDLLSELKPEVNRLQLEKREIFRDRPRRGMKK